jgi:DNA-binding LacI/PurR family transcriptional regulator
MSITQHDIAERLGIGQKTVSRVFTNPEQVSDRLRSQVLSTARDLGYRPNSGARAMRTGRFSSVVLVGSTLTDISPLPERLLVGLDEIFAMADVSLALARLPDDQLVNDFVPKVVRELLSDGLLINYDTNIPQRLIDLISEQKLPAVWINSRQANFSVRPDDLRAGDDLTRCLIEHGHKRILYADFLVDHHPYVHYSRKDRLTGYRTAMARAGLTQHEAVPDHPVEAASYAAAMIERHQPTALISYGDVELTGFILSALRRGLDVPRDMSLATFSHGPAYFGMPIANWLVPQQEVGRSAARMLLAAMREPGVSIAPLVVPYTVDLGASITRPSA